jgi:uncharacterized protein YndB with AHSA1/START domain
LALTLEIEMRVGAPGEKAWLLLSDPRTWKKWWPVVQEGRTADHRTLKEGSELDITVAFGWLRLRHTGRVIVAIPPKSLSWHGHTMGLPSRHEWYLADKAGTASVKHRLVVEGAGGMLVRVLGLQGALEKTMRSGLKGLKRTAEQMV